MRRKGEEKGEKNKEPRVLYTMGQKTKDKKRTGNKGKEDGKEKRQQKKRWELRKKADDKEDLKTLKRLEGRKFGTQE